MTASLVLHSFPFRLRRSGIRRVHATAVALLCASGVSMQAASAASAATPSVAQSVFSEINQERAAHHLPALHWSIRLTSSSHSHNVAMAATNTMSHQVRHEAGLATRVTRTTFPWRICGENIGWNSQQTRAGAVALERMMYGEKAPNDGHRRNILNRRFNYVGVDVYRDNVHHKIWLTTDFAGTS